jgi:ribosomal protein L7/L12
MREQKLGEIKNHKRITYTSLKESKYQVQKPSWDQLENSISLETDTEITVTL